MKLISLPRGGQYGINGPCVNVPATTTAISNLLPQMPEEVQLVDFKLKQKLEYKGHHMTMKVHPQKVLNALEWLMKHNSLYAGISQNSQWERDCEASTLWQYITGQRTSDEQEDIVNSNNDDSRSADIEVPEIVDNNYDNETSEDQAAIDHNAGITTQPFPSCLQLDDIQGGNILCSTR